MADPAPNSQLNRVLRQHAQTTRLFGVDFIPVARRAPGIHAGTVEAKPLVQTDAPPDAPMTKQLRDDGGSVPSRTAPKPRSRSSKAADPAEALERIRELYERDAPHASFVTEFTNIVFGEGSPTARLMFIGEAPGAEEDRTGRPFVGRAGQLLDKMIEAMGLKRGKVYIANVLKTRPPNNATPTRDESRLCAPYLYAQIGAIRPEYIVTLGLPATHLLLESADSMARLRGRWHDFAVPADLPDELAAIVGPLGGLGHAARLAPTYHPAYLLRQYTTENRAKVWADLRMVVNAMQVRSAD